VEKEYLFSSESVCEGHPDKVADQISDAILDAHLTGDPQAHVACNTLVAKNLVMIAGEFASEASIDIEEVVRGKLKEIGYVDRSCGLDGNACKITTSISQQSANIFAGVEHNDGEIGAGDQGMMFGYAVDETPELMPLGITLAHKLVKKQAELRKSGKLPWLKPDGKSQVTVRYRGGKPVAVEKVIFSTHHAAEVQNPEIREAVISQIIEKVLPSNLHNGHIEYFINPAGRFEFGGPQADTGLTGRKIIVDTYGGYCPHGGGAFSGKDPTKVDRSAAYMARYIAKNIVAAGLASRCTVQFAYAIGVAEPTSIMFDLHGSGRIDEVKLEKAVRQIFKMTPRGIIDSLNLRRPIYQKTAAYGHFGRELPEFTWERTDKVSELRSYFNM
jgi:S-adenosylmethionine synthetase